MTEKSEMNLIEWVAFMLRSDAPELAEATRSERIAVALDMFRYEQLDEAERDGPPKGYKGFRNAQKAPLSRDVPDAPKGWKRVKKGSFWVMQKVDEDRRIFSVDSDLSKDQLDEISQELKDRYTAKAMDSHDGANMTRKYARKQADKDTATQVMAKRARGLNRAYK